MKTFILMLQFFTRIPINVAIDVKEDSFARGIVYFPLVGLVIGLFNGIIYFGASKFLNGLFPIVLTVLAEVLITGAFHVDGLADTCDGVFSSRKKERMLEIMKDSRIGTNGTIAIIFDLLFRITLLSNLNYKYILLALVLSPVIAKTVMILLIYFSTYARSEGLGGLFIGKVKSIRVVIGIVICLSLGIVLLGYKFIILFVINIVVIEIYKKFIYSKIDGMTGDTLGAANEISEIICIISMIVLRRYMLL